MSRPKRLQFHGAVYHVTARGNRRANMFVDDHDRHIWLSIFAEAVARFNLAIYALCLMPNHFHLLVETPDANLSSAMHYLNGKYAQKFNWRHALSGHLHQGRYHAVHVERQEQLLELLRYIVLNPVRAQLVAHADDWHWSTHSQVCGLVSPPAWLNIKWIMNLFSGATDTDRLHAYRAFVDAGSPSPARPCSNSQQDADKFPEAVTVPALDVLERQYPHRKAAITAAWCSGAYTRDQIARHFGISTKTVARLTVAGLAISASA